MPSIYDSEGVFVVADQIKEADAVLALAAVVEAPKVRAWQLPHGNIRPTSIQFESEDGRFYDGSSGSIYCNRNSNTPVGTINYRTGELVLEKDAKPTWARYEYTL
jgi:hypothetical protein